MMFTYIDKEHLTPLFAYLAERYAKIEEVPNYEDEAMGIEKLLGVLERIQVDSYYPAIFDKAASLLIQVNKGHFFSNGNKRLALVLATTFLHLNDRQLKSLSKELYRALLGRLFPAYTGWTDFPEFSSTDFAMYNLSVVVADSVALGIDHDDLKARVKAFFVESAE